MKEAHRSRIWMLSLLGLALVVFFSIQARIFASSWIGRPAPPIKSEVWLNTAPLEWSSLRGKVVLVDMWTFG